MEGVVKFVNEDTNLFVVETENAFAVFELVDTDHIEPGDVVSGSLESGACESLFNNSKHEELEAE